AVVKIGDVVVCDDMSRSINLHGNIGRHLRRIYLPLDASESLPYLAGPADHVVWIIASVKPVIGDVEVARARIVAEDACAYVFKTAFLYGESLRTGNKLCTGQDPVLRVPESQALEIGVVRSTDVKQRKVSVAIEDRRSIACSLDRDGHFGCPIRCQVVR